MAEVVTDWLYRDHLPRDLFELVGRKRLDPDLEGLQVDLDAARRALTQYQNHPHPVIVRQAKRLLQEVERWLDARGRLRPLDDCLNEIVEQLRDEYGRRQGVDRWGWDRTRLRRWLEREGCVHPASVHRALDALLDETALDLPRVALRPVGGAASRGISRIGECLAQWTGAQFYWRHRGELWQAINDCLDDGPRSEKDRTLWFDADDDESRATFADGEWTVQLVGRCVVCGARSTGPARVECVDVVDCARPLWAPLAGLLVGSILAVFFWSKWFLPIGLFCGFVAGARCAPAVRVQLHYHICPAHERKRRVPKARLVGGRLAIEGIPRATARRRDAYDECTEPCSH